MDKFDQRAGKYTRERVELFDKAIAQVPEARAAERECAIARMRLEEGLKICDVSAGSGYLSDGVFEFLRGNVEITCIENSQAFAEILGKRHRVVRSSLSKILLPDRCFDRVACLVGVHHQEDKAAFYREAHRILKAGGSLVVGDVSASSPPARFLNGPVDEYSDLGHDGMFLREEETVADLRAAGFTNIDAQIERYTWNYPDEESMVLYCKNLFRMTKASIAEVADAISKFLTVSTSPDGCHLHWQLLFVSADK